MGDHETTTPLISRRSGIMQKIYPGGKSVDRAKEELFTHPPYKEADNYSNFTKAVVGIVIYLGVGILSFYLDVDDLSGTKTTSNLADALYFSVVTLTTIGYGDLVPGSTAGKLFICLYVFAGFGLIGALVSGAANYLVEKQEQIVVHIIKRKELKGYEHADYEDAQAAAGKVYVTGVLVLVLSLMGLGFLLFVEGMSFIDALYCVCVTVTTLGYGDYSFHTPTGRLFAAIWLLCSTASVAQLFLYVAEMRTENRQLELARWVLHRKTTKRDLEKADIDGNNVVSCAEFVILKLKELGKIDEDEVAGITDEFRSLNYDGSGFISTHDDHFADS